MMPVTRRIYAYDTNKQKILDPVLVAIDMRDIAFSADEDADDCTPRFQQTPKNRLALYT